MLESDIGPVDKRVLHDHLKTSLQKSSSVRRLNPFMFDWSLLVSDSARSVPIADEIIRYWLIIEANVYEFVKFIILV
jgi:hypothetical protein